MSEKPSDWDPLAPPALNDPLGAQAELRARCPVAWTNRAGGFWAVTRYEDIAAAVRDSETFINGGGPQWGTARPPLEVDRPVHTHFRRLLQPYFHKRRMAALEPSVRESVVEMLEPLLAAGGGDIAPALTYPLPARVLAAFLHLPDSAWGVPQGLVGGAVRERGGPRERPAEGAGGQPAAVRLLRRDRRRAEGESARPRRGSRHRPAPRGRRDRGRRRPGSAPAPDRRPQLDDERARHLHPRRRSGSRGAAAPPRGAGADPLRGGRVHASRDAGDGDAALGGPRHEPERANDRRGRPALPRLAVGQPRPRLLGGRRRRVRRRPRARTRTSSSATACTGASATWSRCSSCA